MKQSVAIVGARGYSGLVLARLILAHPHMELGACFSRDSKWSLEQELPKESVAQIDHLSTETLSEQAHRFATVFLATPAEVSVGLVHQLKKQENVQIIDLSGGFRLDPENHFASYGFEQTEVPTLKKSIYGLVPFASKEALCKAPLIANPGCYATSVLMALIPLLKSHLIQKDSLVIDAKSGATGAGRTSSESLSFAEVEGGCLPYKVGQHQHLPEIIKYAHVFSGENIDPFFTTYLLPVRRGIISGIYGKAINHSQKSDSQITQEISDAYKAAYEGYPLVDVTTYESKDSKRLLALRKVVGSARVQITFHVQQGKIYIFSIIDNLMKGAASQAIENWNLSHGYDLDLGLNQQESLI